RNVEITAHFERFPRRNVLGRIYDEIHLFLGYGMRKTQFRRPQREIVSESPCVRAVFAVSEKGTAYRRHLHPYLMRSARHKLYPHERKALFDFEHVVMQFRLFRS